MHLECPRLPSPLVIVLSFACIAFIPLHAGTDPATLAISGGLLATTAYTAWAIGVANREITAMAERMEANITMRLDEFVDETNFSKAYFESRLNQEIRRSIRYGSPLSVIYAELSIPFRASADASVILAGARLLRTEDTFAPIGAGEYAFFLPQTAADGARVVVARLAGALSDYEPDFGLAQLVTGMTTDAEALIEAARADARRSSVWNESVAVR